MRISAIGQPSPTRRTPRLVATLALFVLGATLFCAIAGTVLVRQADDRQEVERRGALLGAIEDIRNSGADFRALDPRHIRGMERTAGLKELRFETEPVTGDREIQSVLDRQGRIIGWFSWEPERSFGQALVRLRPLLAVTGLCLVLFAGVALWQVRRSVRDLGTSEQRAWSLAHEDDLTRLPNHRKMIELIDDTMQRRAPSEVVTLALLDLDGLNDINDQFGHGVGDDLLVALATRLKEMLPAGASGGRFDGDEFAVLMTNSETGSAEIAVQVLTEGLARPYWIREQAVQLGVTAGLAHAPMHAGSRDELTRRADLALRSAKRKQRGGVLRYQEAMEAEFEDRRFIERELRRALADKTLDLHYQPIVSADGHRVVGAEALLRWNHPLRGAIPPATFVPVAEQAGLMGQLGDFVLRRALSDARRWPSISIAVNLSPIQVRDPRLVEFVSDRLAQNRIAPSRLLLEVTEGVMIDNPAEAKVRLQGLQALGVKLALDDFGTGYSSLAYLQQFRFDKLKIDKAFVDPLGRAPGSEAMIQAIVALGRALNLTLLAEGVETEEQRVLLRLAGCDEMQGYLFARPAPREALDKLLAASEAQLPSRAASA